MPLPESAIDAAVGSLSTRSIAAARGPVVDGVKRVVIVQLCSNASLLPEQASAVIAKSAALAPVTDAPPITSACAPTLVTVTGTATDLWATVWSPKSPP